MADLTLSTLHRALTLAHGPGVERPTDRTPAGIVAAYLPHKIVLIIPADLHGNAHPYKQTADTLAWLGTPETGIRITIDLTDPAMVRALPVLLALGLGLDPGPMGLAVSWGRFGRASWALEGDDRIVFIRPESVGADDTDIVAPEIALEPDPVRALVLALQWVIERSP